MAKTVGAARSAFLREGKPVFIIGDHYGITSLLSFYLPEARAGISDRPLVYYRSSAQPENQFYFWRGYHQRKGENAIFVQEVETSQPPPEQLQKEFESVVDLGICAVSYRGRTLRQIQLFQCRYLR